MKQTIEEKIKQRRLQILVHSYIYYELDQNIISDTQWNKWAHELVQLQKDYPKESKSTMYYEEFKNFDGSTGMDLDFSDSSIRSKALTLLSMQNYQKSPGNVKSVIPTKSIKASKQADSKKKKLF